MNIILIGFKSCGKSTVGRRLADRLGMGFTDTDTLIEAQYAALHEERASCRAIYATCGADVMRDLERAALAAAARREHTVIATGGGIVLEAANRAALRATGVCVFLDVPLPVLEARLRDVDSPLFTRHTPAELHAARLPIYREVAHITLSPAPTDEPDHIAAAVSAAVEEYTHGR